MNRELAQLVEVSYPWPIAMAFKRYRKLRIENKGQESMSACALSEVITKYICICLLRSYLLTDGSNRLVNSLLRGFRTPSHGKWCELLRALGSVFADARMGSSRSESTAPVAAFCSQWAAAYFGPLPGGIIDKGFQHALLLLKEFPDVAMECPDLQPSVSNLLDLIGVVRNKIIAHGSGERSPGRSQLLHSALENIFDSVMPAMICLQEFPLVSVKETNIERGGLVAHSVEVCMGCDFEPRRLRLENEQLEPKELYLLSPFREENNVSRLDWAIPLGPFLIKAECPVTHSPQVFVFTRTSKANRIEYSSYGNGESYSPDSYDSDFAAIFEFLEGKKTIYDLFRGKTVAAALPPDSTTSIGAARVKAAEALQSANDRIDRGEYVLALSDLRTAVQLDPDAAEAHFRAALCLMVLEEAPSGFLMHLERACTLSPNNALYPLTLAQVLIELDMSDDARIRLQAALAIDPSNSEARRVLGLLGSES